MNENEQMAKNRLLHVLKMLWQRFKQQKIQGKLITLMFIFLTLIITAVFFSALLIWWVVKFVLFKVFLYLSEWYLIKTQPKV